MAIDKKVGGPAWAGLIPSEDDLKDRRRRPAGPEEPGDEEEEKAVGLKDAIGIADYVLGLPMFYISSGGGKVVESKEKTSIKLEFEISHNDEYLTAQLAELDNLILLEKETLKAMEDRRRELNGRRTG